MFLWRVVDVGIIDGTVNGVAIGIGALSQRLRHVQTGLVANYALAIALGMVVMVGVYLAGSAICSGDEGCCVRSVESLGVKEGRRNGLLCTMLAYDSLTSRRLALRGPVDELSVSQRDRLPPAARGAVIFFIPRISAATARLIALAGRARVARRLARSSSSTSIHRRRSRLAQFRSRSRSTGCPISASSYHLGVDGIARAPDRADDADLR